MQASAQTGTPPLELWYQQHSYLTSPDAVTSTEATIAKAAADGYTGLILWDSALALINQPQWQTNITYMQQVIAFARSKGLKIIPEVFPYGFGNDILYSHPDWAEGQHVTGSQFQVSSDGTTLTPISNFPGLSNPGFESGATAWFSYNDGGVSLDATVAHTGTNSGRISNAPYNARLAQKFAVTPWRQYHLRFWLKTGNFYWPSGLSVYVSDAADLDAQRLNTYIPLSGVANVNQDWTPYDYTVNSGPSTSLNIMMALWGGSAGTLWVDDVTFEETSLVYLLRRNGTPLSMYDPANPSHVYQEGSDFNYVSDPGLQNRFQDKWHTPPVVTLPSSTSLKPGQVVAMDFYAIEPWDNTQVGICPSEPDALTYMSDNMSETVSLFGLGTPVLFGYDELRHWNSCGVCMQKNMTAGQLLGWSVGQSVNTLNQYSYGSMPIFWSDMFDPSHNAHGDYYWAQGDFSGSWQGLPANALIMNWNLGNLTNSLKWFAGQLDPTRQPNQYSQMISGFYDPADNDGAKAATTELQQAAGIPGVTGLMYTTWNDNYSQLAQFAAAAKQGWNSYRASTGVTAASAAGSILGTLVDSVNRPVAGVNVSATSATSNAIANATTGVDGTFLLSNLAPGTYVLAVAGPGYTSPNVTQTVSANTLSMIQMTVSPTTFSPIRINAGGGPYTDAAGNLWSADAGFLSGATYLTYAGISNTPDQPLYQTERYNPGGILEYQFAAPNGSYQVKLKFSENWVTGPGQRLLNIMINGQGVAQNFDIYALAGGGFTAYDATFAVSVTNNIIDIQLVPVIQNAKINAIEITSSGTAGPATISGAVTNLAGTAVSGATVSYSGGSTTTAANGNYQLANVPAGSVSINVTAPGYQSATQRLTVAANSTVTQNFVLASATGTVSGTVTNSAGGAISGATVAYRGGSTTTAADGSFTLASVPAGSVTISVAAANFARSSQKTTVSAGRTTNLSFALTPLTGSVSGAVTTGAGKAVSGAIVAISGGVLPATITVMTDATGRYRSGLVPVGTYKITVTKGSYATQTKSALVSASVAAILKFIMTR